MPSLLVIGVVTATAAAAGDDQLAGELPAVQEHIPGDGMNLDLNHLFILGERLMSARFNALDGLGRPASTGTGAPRVPDEPAFIRTSGVDSVACSACHSQPRPGGGGDFVVNVFVLAQTLDPVTFSIAPEFGNERNTLGMMGSGPIEMLAREMSQELIDIREEARTIAMESGVQQIRELWAKNVYFGLITVMPDGTIDPSLIEGVDWDLIIKPFHQKGASVSLREFTNNALNHHHGMQSVERFGEGVDADQDGVADELTVGDVTALTIFQAALNTPGRALPRSPSRRAAAVAGEQIFKEIGCAACHIPAMSLDDRHFTEPNPFNPEGNLRPQDVEEVFAFDMTRDGEKPRLEKDGDGATVRAFTDLKRHNLNDEDYDHFNNELLPQGSLVGFASPDDFTIDPQPRPTAEFLTRKLWDVGNSAPYGHRGDLGTMTEAIYYHGGEARASRDAFYDRPPADRAAVIEFLRTLQVLPPGSPRHITVP